MKCVITGAYYIDADTYHSDDGGYSITKGNGAKLTESCTLSTVHCITVYTVLIPIESTVMLHPLVSVCVHTLACSYCACTWRLCRCDSAIHCTQVPAGKHAPGRTYRRWVRRLLELDCACRRYTYIPADGSVALYTARAGQSRQCSRWLREMVYCKVTPAQQHVGAYVYVSMQCKEWRRLHLCFFLLFFFFFACRACVPYKWRHIL